MAQEEWIEVSGWPYEVSSLGRIRRTGEGSGARVGMILSPVARPNGYLAITLSHKNKQKPAFVHALVCAAFHGARRPGMQVRHLDGDKSNNRSWNLAWGSASDNASDKRDHGTLLTGDRHPRTRIPEDKYRAILSAWETWPKGYGKTAAFISEMGARYGATKSLVEDAIYGRVRASRVRAEMAVEERRAL